jgi:hypothetical protein
MGKFPGSLTSRSMVINFSQGLRDKMIRAGYDNESWRIDRACLAEKNKSAAREDHDDGAKLAMRHEGEPRVEGPVLERGRLLATEKRVSHVLAPSMFTDEQMLEKRLKTATPCHFWAGPARLQWGKSVITRRWRITRSDMSHIPRNPSQNPVS